MKKITAFLTCLAMITTFAVGCGDDNNSSSSSSTSESNSQVESSKADTEEADDEENYETGDASLDKIRNEDNIGDNELLVLSFGTSFNDSRRLTIGAIEEALDNSVSDDYSVRRGFTANIVIDHINRRDGVLIDDIDAALKRAVDNKVKNLVIQPTHLMSGIEYDEIVEKVAQYSDAFDKVVFGKPLLTSEDDFKRVEAAITDWTKDYSNDETAVVFMGHGTEHKSNEVYSKMQDLLTADGFSNYFIGTVEATPSLEDVIAAVKKGGYKKVVLEPLMVVAGDHANNDMAGDDEDSWKLAFEKEGIEVECLLRGLGENESIRSIYVDHANAAIAELENK